VPTFRASVLVGIGLGTAIGLVCGAALRAGMAPAGVEGGLELVAFVLFVITLPAGALAAVIGRLVAPLGSMTAFVVTALTWMLLCVPYTVIVAHAVRRWRLVSTPTT
jgi:hypothetical protein